MAKTMIGIEISSNDVSMAQITGKGANFCTRRLPENMVENGIIVAPKLMSKFLRKMKKEGKFSGSRCCVILPENATFFRNFDSPAVSASQLKLNLPYEFRDFVGQSSMDYYYDYAVKSVETGESGKPQVIHMFAAAAQKRAVTEYADILKKAGMKLKIALPREMALINLLRANESDEKNHSERCLVDVGFSRTHVYIFSGSDLKASKVIDIGCKQVDEAVAQIYNIDPYLAATYRLTNHENVLDDPTCRDVYEEIALEIMKAINFYRYENQQTTIHEAFFCGEGAGISDLTEQILTFIQFEELPLSELMPDDCNDSECMVSSAMALGVAL